MSLLLALYFGSFLLVSTLSWKLLKKFHPYWFMLSNLKKGVICGGMYFVSTFIFLLFFMMLAGSVEGLEGLTFALSVTVFWVGFPSNFYIFYLMIAPQDLNSWSWILFLIVSVVNNILCGLLFGHFWGDKLEGKNEK